jgi:hypothetical protein
VTPKSLSQLGQAQIDRQIDPRQKAGLQDDAPLLPEIPGLDALRPDARQEDERQDHRHDCPLACVRQGQLKGYDADAGSGNDGGIEETKTEIEPERAGRGQQRSCRDEQSKLNVQKTDEDDDARTGQGHARQRQGLFDAIPVEGSAPHHVFGQGDHRDAESQCRPRNRDLVSKPGNPDTKTGHSLHANGGEHEKKDPEKYVRPAEPGVGPRIDDPELLIRDEARAGPGACLAPDEEPFLLLGRVEACAHVPSLNRRERTKIRPMTVSDETIP